MTRNDKRADRGASGGAYRSDAAARSKELAAALSRCDAQAFVFINDESVNWESLYYMSGFRGTAGALVVYAEYEPELLLDDRYIEQGSEQSPHKIFPLREEPVKGVAERLKERGVKKVLCEADKTFHATWDELSAQALVRDGSAVVKKMRRKKTTTEISFIKKAAQIAADAFLSALDGVKAGMTERQFEALLNYNIETAGGETGFDMIVASGKRGAMPHGRATDKPIEKGECVTVDFGARYGGYFCDVTRNFSIGAPRDVSATLLHELILKAHGESAAALKAGERGSLIHNRAVSVFAEEGKDLFFTHGLGHGFGLEIHEEPSLSPKRDFILEEGDVVTIEPGLYIANAGGLRIEDDYLITRGGAERLTRALEQKLFIV